MHAIIMDSIHQAAFRLFYNSHIHPDLLRAEQLRMRLVRLLLLSLLLGLALAGLAIYLDLAAFTLFITLPTGFYITYLVWRMRLFRQATKRNLVQLILHFMYTELHYEQLYYDPQKFISKELFLQSGIFDTSADIYEGDDYITGRIGMMPFVLSEITVKEISPLANRLQAVFEGQFVYALFGEEAEGSLVLWPRRYKPQLSRSIKAYVLRGGANCDHEITNDSLRERYMVYATEDTHVAGLLTEPMQAAIIAYTQRTGRDLYLAFRNREIFAGLASRRGLLEPSVLSSNLHFDWVWAYYQDIALVLKIVEVFDQTH